MGSFHIGGIVIPYEAGDGAIQQTYQSKHEGELVLLGDGSSIKQALSAANAKLKSTVQVNSMWASAGLAGLDFTQSMLMSCIEPRNVFDTDTSVEVPPNRRSDAGYEPKGYAIVDGRMVETTIDITVNTATLGVVSGASGYLVTYWPEITVFASYQENLNAQNALYGFRLDCEEV